MYLKFKSISRPVLLSQGLKVLPHLARALPKWPFREVPGERFGDPIVNVLQDGDDAIIQAPWIESQQRYGSPVDLAEGLTRHLARSWIEEAEGIIGVAAAAARFGTDLAVFVGGPQSGKSTLVSCLSIAGHAAFADSVLPISVHSGACISLGMAPRLKLPLPNSFSGQLRERVEQCLSGRAPHIGYLVPGEAELSAFGDQASVVAFILLDRAEGSTTSLRPASAGTLLKRLLLGSFDALPSPSTALAVLHDLVTNTPCYRLTWSDPAEAVSALRARFALRIASEAEEGLRTELPSAPRRRRASGPRTPSGKRFRHVDGLDARIVDADTFLVDPNGEAIYHLNSLGTGLWRLLDGSHGLDDVISVLQDAFPTVDPTLVEDDVVRLIGDLADRGLLVEQPAEHYMADAATASP